jgi:hypothetical protein
MDNLKLIRDSLRETMITEIHDHELNAVTLSEALGMISSSITNSLDKQTDDELMELYLSIFKTPPSKEKH